MSAFEILSRTAGKLDFQLAFGSVVLQLEGSTMEQVKCAQCGAGISAQDINLDRMLAKCAACNAVFDFSDQVQMPATPAKLKRDRGEIPMPHRVTVEDTQRGLEITLRWNRRVGFAAIAVAIFWNGIVSFFVVGAATGRMNFDPGVFIWVFLTPFVLLGLSIAYFSLAMLFNCTLIRLQGRRLSINHGPLPWPGNRTLDADSLDQLYCQEYIAYSQNNVPQYRLELVAIMKDRSKIKLIRGIDEPEQGLYLERLLEKRLKIVDRPVPGEYAG